MDRAVLDAYGWTDLKPACEFLLDYEDEEDQELAALPFFGASIPGFVGLLTGRGPFSPAFALIPGRSELATSNQELPTRRRRKPWRYRWPDDFRDEVLARLLELNRQRAEEERLSGAAAEAGRGKPRKKSTAGRKAARKNLDQPEFFES